jgi:hypothetical protein
VPDDQPDADAGQGQPDRAAGDGGGLGDDPVGVLRRPADGNAVGDVGGIGDGDGEPLDAVVAPQGVGGGEGLRTMADSSTIAQAKPKPQWRPRASTA